MESLKVRVENEVESIEVQDLFFELGAKPRSVLKNWKNEDYKVAWFALGQSGELHNEVVFRDNDSGISCSPMFKEITLPQLRDLVVLKRNDVGDATHVGKSESEYYIGDKSYFWDGAKWEQRDFYDLSKLKPIEEKEMKQQEYLVKNADGKYFLTTSSNYPDGIKVPEGAYCYVGYGPSVRKDDDWVSFYFGRMNSNRFVNEIHEDYETEYHNSIDELSERGQLLWERDNPEELKSIGFDLGAEGGDETKIITIENPLFPDFELSEPVIESNDFNGLDKSEINHRVAKAFNVIRGTDLNEDDIHFLRQLIDSVTSHYWDRK